jgi:hypothetical protein
MIKLILFIILSLWCCNYMSIAEANNNSITIGMKKDSLNFELFCESTLIMTAPAQFRKSCRVNVDNTEYILAIDEEDRICKIFTLSGKFRSHKGIGIGYTFKDIKDSYANFKILSLLGYGKLVSVANEETIFCFPWDEEDSTTIDDDEKIEWIELKAIGVKDTGVH